MRIATFNTNSIRVREGIILAWLAAHKPDVLCIQETKVEDKDFPSKPYEDAGYHVVFRGQKSYNGVALISKIKPTKVRFGFDDGGQSDDTRLLCAKVGSVHVVNTYVPQGRELDHEMYAYKLEWFKRLKAYFEKHLSVRSKVVWVGDVNVAPTDLDVHHPERHTKHVCFHEDVKKAFADTLSWGFEDVFRKHKPGPNEFSFYDFRSRDPIGNGLGWRIDHILATPSLAKKSTGAWIDLEPRRAERPSDHTFMAADFEI